MSRVRRRHPRAAGQAIVLMVIIVGFFFFLGAIFFDFANLFQYHLVLERVANGAARAASTQTTVTVDGRVILDDGRARSTAQAVLSQWGAITPLSGAVAVDNNAGLVTVKVTGIYRPIFASLLSLGQGFPISAQGQYNAVPVG